MDLEAVGVEAKVNSELLSSVVSNKIQRKLGARLGGEYGQRCLVENSLSREPVQRVVMGG